MNWLLIALLIVNGTLLAQTVEGTVVSTSATSPLIPPTISTRTVAAYIGQALGEKGKTPVLSAEEMVTLFSLVKIDCDYFF